MRNIRKIGCGRTRLRTPVLITIAAVFSGCVSSSFMHVGNTYPPRPDDFLIAIYVPLEAPVDVQTSLSNALPLSSMPSDAEIVGRIDSRGAPAASWASVIEDAKGKARQLGGNAIVITRWGTPMVAMNYGDPMYGKAISMNVVRYQGRPN